MANFTQFTHSQMNSELENPLLDIKTNKKIYKGTTIEPNHET